LGARIELHVRRVGEEAVVEVADDGPGIPPRLRDQIFDRFVRGEGPADTAVGPGSGLGLSIVKSVALSHAGTVDVGESATGGAQFQIRIPLTPAQQPARSF
jgi:signal transduction histidine kinase